MSFKVLHINSVKLLKPQQKTLCTSVNNFLKFNSVRFDRERENDHYDDNINSLTRSTLTNRNYFKRMKRNADRLVLTKEEKMKRKELANKIKTAHFNLHQSIKNSKEDEIQIWTKYVDDLSKDYANAIKQLSDEYIPMERRLEWLYYSLNFYFIQQDYKRFFDKINQWQGNKEYDEIKRFDGFSKFSVLDVGSCHNPLLKYLNNNEQFNLMSIDLTPVCDSVIRGDFIQVPLNDEHHEIKDSNLISLKRNGFDAVIFSLFLGIV